MSVCDTYRLQAYVDGQLGESEKRAVEAHLGDCAACARLVQELRMVAEPLRTEAVAAPVGLQERLLAAVAGLEPLWALDCATAREYACLQIDGELTHEDCQRLVAHLDACGHCARFAAETELTSRMLRAIEPERAPLGLLQQIQKATEERTAPAKTPALWRRWAPSVAGVAAAAALVVVLLTNQPASVPVAPMVAQAPALERVAPPVEHTQPQPVEMASVPAAPRTAKASAKPLPGARTIAAAVPVRPASTPARPSAVAWAPVAPTPAQAPDTYRPVAVALAPARVTAPGAPADVPAVTSVRAETPVAPPARTPEVPNAIRVAAADDTKATPAVEVAVRPSVNHRRPSRVSRPAAEREIYASEEADTRLADARARLNDDARRIVGNEIRGFVIH